MALVASRFETKANATCDPAGTVDQISQGPNEILVFGVTGSFKHGGSKTGASDGVGVSWSSTTDGRAASGGTL